MSLLNPLYNFLKEKFCKILRFSPSIVCNIQRFQVTISSKIFNIFSSIFVNTLMHFLSLYHKLSLNFNIKGHEELLIYPTNFLHYLHHCKHLIHAPSVTCIFIHKNFQTSTITIPLPPYTEYTHIYSHLLCIVFSKKQLLTKLIDLDSSFLLDLFLS